MQSEATEAVDLGSEDEATRRLYGLDEKVTRPFGEKCLLARRLVERGVRFVQVYCDDEWDAHNNLADNHGKRCLETDRPIAGLLADLKRRGLLESDAGRLGRRVRPDAGLGEGGRPRPQPLRLPRLDGRRRASRGALGPARPTRSAGRPPATRSRVHDLHATILHLLGLDHTRLTYLHNGRRFRLTDVAGNVLRDLLA